MRTMIFAWMTAMVTGLLAAGCAEPVDSDDDVEALVVYRPMGGGGSTGVNGLGDDKYWAVEGAFLNSTLLPLTDGNTNDVNDKIGQLLLGTPAGITVFGYAVECAVPAGQSVVWNGVKFFGLGHMANAQKWLYAPLSSDAQGDLMACMVAHINPLDLKVPILLSGVNVKDDGQNHLAYPVDEALWVAGFSAAGGPTYTAYALAPLRNKCAADPADALKNRVCGHDPKHCHLDVGDIQDCFLDQEAGGWFCNGQPALKTNLKEADFAELYADCK
jgi:hypothetical protein